MDKKIKPLNIQINLKSLCNLRCKYCVLPEISKSTKSDESKILRNIKLLLLKIKKENMTIKLFSIFGAEPFIVPPDILANVLNLVGFFFPNCMLKVQTNGTLCTNDYMNVFDLILNEKLKNRLTIGWSIDGVKNIHDTWRDNSFDLATKNLFNVAKKYQFGNMVVISTGYIHFTNEKNKTELLNFINECKKSQIVPTLSAVNYSIASIGNVGNTNLSSPIFYENFANFLIENNLIVNNIKNFNPFFCYRDGNDCSKILFDISTGNVYQCEKTFDIGNKPINNYFRDTVRKCIKERRILTCNAEISKECNSCEYKKWCKGGCMLRRDDGLSSSCNLIKKVLTYIKNNIQEDWYSYLMNNKLETLKKSNNNNFKGID